MEGGRGGGSSKAVVGVIIVIVIVVVMVGGGCVGVYMKKRKEGEKRRGENDTEMHLSTGLLNSGEDREGVRRSGGEGESWM